MGLVIHYNLAYTVTGLAMAAGLGVTFIASYIISIVKAVRDRRRIQQLKQFRRDGKSGKVGVDQGQNRRARLNILIIHDKEKERMVKGGEGRAPQPASSDRLAGTSPAQFLMNASALNSSDKLTSGPTECFVAEVLWHHSTDDNAIHSPDSQCKEHIHFTSI